MPTRADPRPPSSGRSCPVLNSTAQGGPLYWARKAARIYAGKEWSSGPDASLVRVPPRQACTRTGAVRPGIVWYGQWRESAGRWPLRESASRWLNMARMREPVAH